MYIQVVEDLFRFIDDVEAGEKSAATVTDLHIELPDPVPVAALQQCLSMVINVEALTLLFPADTPAHFLRDLPFSKLELLKTNLPHRELTAFLRLLPRLSALCLDSCGRDIGERACPLIDADLSNVLTLECPAGCASGASRKQLIRLTVDDRPSVSSLPYALKSWPSSSLVYMCLDFFHDDYDLLHGIMTAIPQIRKLKLLEKPGSTRRESHARRAWNDLARWSRTLMGLSYLEELALRTASAFVPNGTGSVDHEKKMILQWISGTPRQAIHRRSHPTLTHVRVWYRCLEPGNGVITHWSRYTGVWENTLLMHEPLPHTMF